LCPAPCRRVENSIPAKDYPIECRELHIGSIFIFANNGFNKPPHFPLEALPFAGSLVLSTKVCDILAFCEAAPRMNNALACGAGGRIKVLTQINGSMERHKALLLPPPQIQI